MLRTKLYGDYMGIIFLIPYSAAVSSRYLSNPSPNVYKALAASRQISSRFLARTTARFLKLRSQDSYC